MDRKIYRPQKIAVPRSCWLKRKYDPDCCYEFHDLEIPCAMYWNSVLFKRAPCFVFAPGLANRWGMKQNLERLLD